MQNQQRVGIGYPQETRNELLEPSHKGIIKDMYVSLPVSYDSTQKIFQQDLAVIQELRVIMGVQFTWVPSIQHVPKLQIPTESRVWARSACLHSQQRHREPLPPARLGAIPNPGFQIQQETHFPHRA